MQLEVIDLVRLAARQDVQGAQDAQMHTLNEHLENRLKALLYGRFHTFRFQDAQDAHPIPPPMDEKLLHDHHRVRRITNAKI